MNILVAYASRKGSTADIAEAISREIGSTGHKVTVARLRDIATVEGYDAVIAGAPVYTGHIDDELRKFVERNNHGLDNLPVAVFVVGLAPVNPKIGSPERLMEQAKGIFSPFNLVALEIFSGKLDPAQHSFMTKTMISLIKAPTGDFRDWDKIKAWAGSLPGLFGKSL